MKRILFALFVLLSQYVFAQQSEGTITTYINTQIRLKPTLPARTADAFDVLNISKVSLTGTYVNPDWITSIAGSKITGSIDGTIPWANITSTPTTISGYGITDALLKNTTNNLSGTTTFFGGGSADLNFGNSFGNYFDEINFSFGNRFSFKDADGSNIMYLQPPGTLYLKLNGSEGNVDDVLTNVGSGVVQWQHFAGFVWGAGTGTLSDQTDLQTAFNAKQNLDADLTALAALSSTGIIARTGSSTFTARANTGTAGRLTIVNGDGVSGNPTYDISATFEGLLGKVANPLSQFASTTSAQLLSIISNPTGTGLLVFGTSPAFLGSPTVPTQSTGDNSLKIANTAYVDQYAVLNDGQIAVGNASNQAIGRTPSGVITMDNAGAFAFGTERLKVTGTNTLTGNTIVTGSFNLDFTNARTTWNPVYTAAANNDAMFRGQGTMTARGTTSDTFSAYSFIATLNTGAATQTGNIVDIAGTFNTGGGAYTASNLLRITGALGSVVFDSNGRMRLSGVGISFDPASPTGANSINFSTGTASFGFSSTGRFNFNVGTITTTQTIGIQNIGTFAPTTGATGYDLNVDQFTVNQTGSASGATVGKRVTIVPTGITAGGHTQLLLNATATVNTSGSGPFRGLSIEATPGTGGPFYGVTVTSALFRNGFGTATPTAILHLAAGTTAAGSAPIKLTSGSLMTSAEAGGIEFLTDKLYLTITTGAVRKELTVNDVTLTSGSIPFATTNGRITNSQASIDSNGVITTSGSTTSITFDPSSVSQAIYGVTNSGSVKSLIVKASVGISGSVTGGDLSLLAGDAYVVGNNGGGNVIVLAGPGNGSGLPGTIQLQSKVVLSNTLRLKAYTVATLPAGTAGDIAYVTDALAPSYLVTIVGGGAVVTPVFYNGTNWVAQ